MVDKLNCWQYRNCGREQAGLLADTCGQCPVSTAYKYDGINGGIGAGRACWMLANGRHCLSNNGGRSHCQSCEFYRRVLFEEQEDVHGQFHSQPAAIS